VQAIRFAKGSRRSGEGKYLPLNNNNRGNNNRRRGRGNNRQGGGNGQQLNRIDSRARGNAPQMLEKYRKLAHDAHLNGDRVNEEYYLQFADHYFRVIADQRQRQEEQRTPRESRWQEGEEREEVGEFAEAEYNPYPEQGYQRQERAPREDRGEREERPQREDRPQRGERQDRQERFERAPREDRFERAPREERSEAPAEEAPADTADPASLFEPEENPFVRENRGTRGLKPRRPRREEGDAPAGFDASVLPPAIGSRDEAAEAPAEEAPKRRGRPRKAATEEAAE
jgi:hypothetical protein